MSMKSANQMIIDGDIGWTLSNKQMIERNGYQVLESLPDMFDDCIVGVTSGSVSKLVYDYNQLIDKLMESNLVTEEVAEKAVSDAVASLNHSSSIILIHSMYMLRSSI